MVGGAVDAVEGEDEEGCAVGTIVERSGVVGCGVGCADGDAEYVETDGSALGLADVCVVGDGVVGLIVGWEVEVRRKPSSRLETPKLENLLQ